MFRKVEGSDEIASPRYSEAYIGRFKQMFRKVEGSDEIASPRYSEAYIERFKQMFRKVEGSDEIASPRYSEAYIERFKQNPPILFLVFVNSPNVRILIGVCRACLLAPLKIALFKNSRRASLHASCRNKVVAVHFMLVFD